MHFAAGMCGGAAVMAVPCLFLRRGWRHIPLAMTLGGIWALLPDAPRLWREDFTSLPFAGTLGAKDLEVWLHSIGDLFFMHRSLDAQPKEFALLGLLLIVGLYNLCLVGMLWHARRLRTKISRQPRLLPERRHDRGSGSPPPTLNHAQSERSRSDPPARCDESPVAERIGSG